MDDLVRDDVLSRRLQTPKSVILILLLLVIIGLAAFISRILGPNPGGAWQIYLVNFLFWTGVAQAGIIFSCALRITDARWGRPLIRISEGFGSFIPVSFILLIILFMGKDHILPYATEHYHPPKEIWLNIPFVISRNLGGFFILIILSFFYVYYSLRIDLGGVADRLHGISSWVASGWHGDYERDKIWPRIKILAPAVVLVYVIVFSLFAWDLMMSLDPEWYSTLFGPFYFVGNFVAAIGGTIIISSFVRKYSGLQAYITRFQYHDMGKLLLGFSLFWVYLFFSQFLPIWYGNMPEEAGFVYQRARVEPFTTFGWVVLSCCFIFPFITLFSKTNKIVIPILVFIASVSFIGFWLVEYILVIPSFTDHITFGLIQILITLGFLSGFLLTFLWFVRSFPIIPYGDPYFIGRADSHNSGGH
jgi:Ni/Fe-hydrogenase subunit HybB-like protein